MKKNLIKSKEYMPPMVSDEIFMRWSQAKQKRYIHYRARLGMRKSRELANELQCCIDRLKVQKDLSDKYLKTLNKILQIDGFHQ
jgi:hypothetical protein